MNELIREFFPKKMRLEPGGCLMGALAHRASGTGRGELISCMAPFITANGAFQCPTATVLPDSRELS